MSQRRKEPKKFEFKYEMTLLRKEDFMEPAEREEFLKKQKKLNEVVGEPFNPFLIKPNKKNEIKKEEKKPEINYNERVIDPFGLNINEICKGIFNLKIDEEKEETESNMTFYPEMGQNSKKLCCPICNKIYFSNGWNMLCHMNAKHNDKSSNGYMDKKELLSCVEKKVQKVESVISRLKNSLSLTLQTNADGKLLLNQSLVPEFKEYYQKFIDVFSHY